MPELSIVIPVFNGEKYIQMCYEGIASQLIYIGKHFYFISQEGIGNVGTAC